MKHPGPLVLKALGFLLSLASLAGCSAQCGVLLNEIKSNQIKTNK